MTLYNSEGRAVAYSDDETIYLFNGVPVAYFYGDEIYNFSGQHLGIIEDGWVRDNKGLCVFFTENATGGPIKPIKHPKPIKAVKQIKPIKGVRHILYSRPVDKLAWSNLSGERFFLSM